MFSPRPGLEYTVGWRGAVLSHSTGPRSRLSSAVDPIKIGTDVGIDLDPIGHFPTQFTAISFRNSCLRSDINNQDDHMLRSRSLRKLRGKEESSAVGKSAVFDGVLTGRRWTTHAVGLDEKKIGARKGRKMYHRGGHLERVRLAADTIKEMVESKFRLINFTRDDLQRESESHLEERDTIRPRQTKVPAQQRKLKPAMASQASRKMNGLGSDVYRATSRQSVGSLWVIKTRLPKEYRSADHKRIEQDLKLFLRLRSIVGLRCKPSWKQASRNNIGVPDRKRTEKDLRPGLRSSRASNFVQQKSYENARSRITRVLEVGSSIGIPDRKRPQGTQRT
ncbi:hypothetical protein K438DRAFT_1758387 [Mycena galopus ATCC 62051]|nr:hypothetical protein K438DRAFT_1758387 [Mycena galopus ATCC 62051]